jgi:hypothetical protein
MLSLKLRPAPTKSVEDHQPTRSRDMLLPLLKRFSASVSTSNRHARGTRSQSLTYSIVRFVVSCGQALNQAIKRFAQGDKADAQRREFLKRTDQIEQGSPPTDQLIRFLESPGRAPLSHWRAPTSPFHAKKRIKPVWRFCPVRQLSGSWPLRIASQNRGTSRLPVARLTRLAGDGSRFSARKFPFREVLLIHVFSGC